MVQVETIRWPVAPPQPQFEILRALLPRDEVRVEVTCLDVRDACVAQSLDVRGATVRLVGPGSDYAAILRAAVRALKLAALIPRTAAPRFARVAARLRALTLNPADAAFNADLVVAIEACELAGIDAVLATRGLGPLRPSQAVAFSSDVH
ncbi:hypothetical protein OJ998_24775 [Solirubrobacter taibaiensis]|nr:hypothetical protein [Solirubrobacter taibaiensis]